MDLRGLPGPLGTKRLRETVPVQAARCRIDGGRDANRILVKSLSMLLQDRFCADTVSVLQVGSAGLVSTSRDARGRAATALV